MAIIITDTYSDHDMQCPAGWENGFKEGIVMEFGAGERTASERFTGEWSGSTFQLTFSDTRRRLRQQLASAVDRYWTQPLTIRMTTVANRGVLGLAYTVFVGPIVEIRPTRDLRLELTLGDIVSQGLLSDQYQVPWRLIRDGFLSELPSISEALDLERPEPIIYGRHRRVPDTDPASADGFQWTPIYLGIEGAYHVWMVCGHACADIPEVLVWTPDPDIIGLGTSVSVLADGDWLIPHTSAPNYEDRHSATFGGDRRYTLIRGLVGNADADACSINEKTLTCFIDGIEPIGDGTGEYIADRIQQYKHFLINFVAHRGQESYQVGNWLTNPTWNVFDGTVPIVDEASFDACSAIAEIRLPGTSGNPAYIGAAIIGAKPGDRASVKRWIADWNRSCGVQFGITHEGQIRVFMLHPTPEGKAAAPLYTAAYEILDGSFAMDFRWQDKVNRIPFRADYEHTSGEWKTADVAAIDEAITLYGMEIIGDVREYPFAPGITMAFHLAGLEARVRMHPPRLVQLEATIGPINQASVTDPGESLGYLDLGDYIRYEHFAEVGYPGEIRLAQVIRHQVQAGTRRVLVEAIDCEELIGYDVPIDEGLASGSAVDNETCGTAIDMTDLLDELGNYTIEIDTTNHGTDGAAPAFACMPGAAYHAAWWKYSPPIDQIGHVTTGGSNYDTVLGVFRGACGALDPVDCNDNDGIFTTSFVEFTESTPLFTGFTYYFLAIGYGSPDSGQLTFTFHAEGL